MKLLFIVLMLTSSTASAISRKYIEEGINKASVKTGVPAILIKAICHAESKLKPSAYNHADGGGNAHALGMCQVLYRTAREHGLKDDKCLGDFRDTPKKYSECKLFGPHTNALYAAKYIKWQLDRYDGSWINAIAAYNSGSVKTCPSKGFFYVYVWDKKLKGLKQYKKECTPGGLLNQYYVDRVMDYIIKELNSGHYHRIPKKQEDSSKTKHFK